MRKALVVGIDYYENIKPLFGCVRDAHRVRKVLERHGDGTINFGCVFLAASDAASRVKRSQLRDAVIELFRDDSEVALFYFAGHGHVDETGGFLCTSASEQGADGVSLLEVLTIANRSRAKNKVILLDSCFAGTAGDHPLTPRIAEISQGVTILTAATETQYASEENGSGVFTSLFVDALGGAAANLVGEVTPGSVYAHIDQSLGPWKQRPVFKTNVKNFISLRRVQPAVPLSDLQRLTEFFPFFGSEFRLDPTFAPERAEGDAAKGIPDPVSAHTDIFAILQRFNRVNLVVPVDVPHMWHAAMKSKSCRLTVSGEHYRRLVEDKQI